MAAIITNDVRVFTANQFIESVGETANSSIYMFIGRPAYVAANAEIDNVNLVFDTWDNMIALKKVTSADIKPALRKYVWTSGNVYTAYTQDNPNIWDTNYVVINASTNEVFKCLGNANGGASTVAPTEVAGVTTGNTTLLADGYRWHYMYTVSAGDLAKFGTPSFIPFTEDTTVANAAIAGGILHVDVNGGGSGYSVAPQVVFQGSGSGANAYCNMSGGSVANVTIDAVGTGYHFANILLIGGSPTSAANLIARLSPPGGHGKNQQNELNASYAVLNTRLETTDTAFPDGITYHQVGLVQDPKDFGTNTVSTASTLRNYKTLILGSSYAPTLYQGNVLTQTTTGANAYLINKTSDNLGLNFIQNRTISSNLTLNFRNFSTGDTVSATGIGSLGTISSIANANVAAYSGKLIYVDTRAPITRASTQTESISIILEF